MKKTAIVVPNWNGKKSLGACLDSLLGQSINCIIIVVENGSTDNSLAILKKNYPDIEIIENSKNLGFAGGVNQGIKKAINLGAEYVALFNNDAVADKNWLKELVGVMHTSPEVGIVAPKLLSSDEKHLDSTGDQYTSWGLPYPRGRRELDVEQYSKPERVFAASGGASLYRVSMLKEIGLFDENFFAYYEDVDISFRAQLTGWKVAYEPSSIAYHEIGATSSKIPGFTTYQTIKNLTWLFWKNVPRKYLFKVGIRFYISYFSFIFSAISRGQIVPVLKGCFVSLVLMPKKLLERHKIQSGMKVSPEYIWSIITHDLPPNADNLKNIRAIYRKILFKD
jgi:hypothetical protein